jgi:carbonic anhydrase/acetyltransferase-like protein (isoleucine patch superfamily)
MLVEHRGKRPQVDRTAYIAPNAVLCGDVRVGPSCRILFGAVLTAEGGPVTLGEGCIVMENAVIRGTKKHELRIGKHCLVGPRAYLSGCYIEDDVFVSTGSTVFNGARIGTGAELRVNSVVHVDSIVLAGTTVPIGWVAVGHPAEVLPPGEHAHIWALQEPLDFPRVVFGLKRAPTRAMMPLLVKRYTRALGTHRDDDGVEEK